MPSAAEMRLVAAEIMLNSAELIDANLFNTVGSKARGSTPTEQLPFFSQKLEAPFSCLKIETA